MADVDKWAPVDDDNADVAPAGAPEGMARTLVSDTFRAMLGALRRVFELSAWFDRTKGPVSNGFVVTRVNDTKLNLEHESGNVSAEDKYPVGARVRVGSAVPVYQFAYVVAATHTPGTPDTVVELDIDGDAVALMVAPVELVSHITDDSMGTAAWSDIGTTKDVYPPEIPTADDLGDAAYMDQGDGNNLDADSVDGLHAADLISSSAEAARSLPLLNGNFQVAQRGEVIDDTTYYPNDNAAYTLDQWVLLMGKGTAHPAPGAGVVDVKSIASGAQDGEAAPFCCRLEGNGNVGVAPVEKVGVIQWLPNDAVGNLEGGEVSLSYWARASGTPASGIQKSNIALVVWDGVADALSSVDPVDDWGAVDTDPTMDPNFTLLPGTADVLSTSWQYFTHEAVTVPAGAKNIGVMVWGDDTAWTAGDQLDIAGVNLVKGALSQRYINEDYATNLMRCSRFFQTTFLKGQTPAEKSGFVDSAIHFFRFDGGQMFHPFVLRAPLFDAATPALASFNPWAGGTSGTTGCHMTGTPTPAPTADGTDFQGFYVGNNQITVWDYDVGPTAEHHACHYAVEALL